MGTIIALLVGRGFSALLSKLIVYGGAAVLLVGAYSLNNLLVANKYYGRGVLAEKQRQLEELKKTNNQLAELADRYAKLTIENFNLKKELTEIAAGEKDQPATTDAKGCVIKRCGITEPTRKALNQRRALQ